jgi:hypothetical protein
VGDRETVRFGIDLIQEPPAIVFVEDTSEAPRLMLKGLNVLYFNKKNVTRLGGLDLERAGEVMDLGEVDVQNVISTVVVLDLSTSPVETLYLDSLSILDGTTGGDWQRSDGISERREWVAPSGCHLFCKH